MMIFTALVGELSSQMSALLQDPTLPAKLGMASSVFALVIGSLWTVRAVSLFDVSWGLWWRALSRRLLPSMA